jgi:DNA-binding response OmpR family regulator/HPt (histidine-containing phosphotransfer) domain-containing protein
MIGAPTDEQARLSGARGDFVASMPRRLEVLRAALASVDEQPRDEGRVNGLLRRLHALGSAARVLGFASVAEALGEAEKTVRRSPRGGPAPSDLADVARALDLLPSLVLGAKGAGRAPELATRAEAPRLSALAVLVFGPEPLADALRQQGDLRVECEPTHEPGKARELLRAFAPDVAVIDADRGGARELVELLAKDPLIELVPIVVVGDFTSPEQVTALLAAGATRGLQKPVSPDMLRRTLIELCDRGAPATIAREALGELNVTELVERMALELRRGLIDAVEPGSRGASVGFGEGTDVMSAVWAAVARVRELVTLKSEGNVRFEPTGPEGGVPLAPWSDGRRVAERGGRDNRAGDGVSLQGRRVVVADDDPAVVWFLSGILKAVGAQVHEAHDGERAFELTAALWPDLVVSDVLMPKLDGFSLCHEIKRDVAVRDVPVILLSWKEDLLQRVRELGGDADGYLRKEAAASTVVERLREVLRARARVEQRVASGGEVRGRLDGLTPRLVLELACRARRDARISIRDSSYLYEIQVRKGAPRAAIRSAADGSFERGEGVLSMLLGVSAGRFVIQPDEAPCRAELSGSLHEQLAQPIARARAAQRALSEGQLPNVTRVVFDEAHVGAYLACTPEPAQALLSDLLAGASPRELLASGRASARLLEAVLSDIARRGGVLKVESSGGGVEDILQTQVPPTVAPPLSDVLPGLEAPAAELAVSEAPAVEPAPAGAFSFELEASAEPPEVAALEPPPRVEERGERVGTKTLLSWVPPQATDEVAPGASIPVQRGHRPPLGAETLGSAGNEAAAALAAAGSERAPASVLHGTRSPSSLGLDALDDDLLAQALMTDTPPPAASQAEPSVPAPVSPSEERAEPAAAPAEEGAWPRAQAELAAAAAEEEAWPRAQAEPAPDEEAWPREEQAASPRKAAAPDVRPQAPEPRAGRARRDAAQGTSDVAAPEKPAVAVEPEAAGWGRTVVFAALAASASYFGVTALFGSRAAEQPREAAPEAALLAPSPVAVVSAAPVVPGLKLAISEAPLPPGTDVPPGRGLLELQVPDGTAIRIDGEYLGMGPGRRVPLLPGEHQLSLGEGPAQAVAVKQGQRTLVVAQAAAAGSP